MNHVTAAYVEECARPGSRLRDVVERIELPPTYAVSYAGRVLARPIFALDAEVRSFAADLVALLDLLASLPDRCFGGDLRRFGAALGMDPRLVELAVLGTTGRPTVYGRADAYHDGTSFKLLELNVGSEMGGIDAAQMNRAFLGVGAFAEFAAAHALDHVDTTAVLADALLDAGRRVTSRRPVVALVEGTGGLAENENVFVAIREAMRAHGFEILLAEVGDVASRAGRVTVHGTPVDVVLRYFAAGQLVDDPAGHRALDVMTRADASGATALFTPLVGTLYASKATFALVHDPAVRAALTGTELELVDRTVPWTRLVGGPPGDDHDEVVEQCRAERESLILKLGIGYGAVGAVLGREVDDRTWTEALTGAANRDYVVQRVVTPAPEPVCDPRTGAVEDWRANWGVFVAGAGYAGVFGRALRTRDGSIIAFSNPGTCNAAAFTHPGPPARRGPAAVAAPNEEARR